MATLSIVIPIHNEEPSILPLYDRLSAVLHRLRRPYEIIFVDDASTDLSFDLLANLVETDHRLKVIRLRRSFGHTAALAAGFDESQGSIIVSLDGGLRHAPEDIPALLEKIDEGYDIASGWRRPAGGWLTRKFPSLAADWLMARVSKVKLRDFSSTFKAYRAAVIKDINLYGELHRFIPALAAFYGARIAEVQIRHAPRGVRPSRHGRNNTLQLMFDVVTIWFLLKYFTRPMHFFGKWGAVSTALGGALLAFLGGHALWTGSGIASQNTWMLMGGLAIATGVMLFCAGLLGEGLTRTYFESQGRRVYAVREIRTRREEKAAGGAR